MYNMDKICAYITFLLHEESNRYVLKKSELKITKEKLAAETEQQKKQLDEYKIITEQKLQLIKAKQKIPGISSAAIGRLDEIHREIAEHIDKIDEKINRLYDEYDEQIEKIDEQIYEADEKINEINDLLDYKGEDTDEKILRELEEEIGNMGNLMNNIEIE